MPKCANPKLDPILRKSISSWRRALGFTRDTMKKMEGLRPEIPIWTRVGEPLFEAQRHATNWIGERRKEMDGIIGKLGRGESENILAAMIGENPGEFFELTAQQTAAARKLEGLLSRILQETGGLTEQQAMKFLKEDFIKLRAARGDAQRFDSNNIYPESFQPFMDELLRGDASATHNNAYAFAWDIINMGARTKFLRPVSREALKLVSSWKGLGKAGVSDDDIFMASNYALDFIKHNVEAKGEASAALATMLNEVLGGLKKYGVNTGEVTPEILDRWSANLTSWYSGMAMSARPALALRDALQPLLGAPKVGFDRTFKAIKDVYGGKVGDEWFNRAAKDLGLPDGISQPLYVGEGTEGYLNQKLFQHMKRAQDIGMLPRRWVDKTNRFVSYRQGELSVLEEAPKLQQGGTWEEFLMATGLKGSPKVDQDKIHSMLMGRDIADVEGAAREYGKILAQDTQFIYDAANAPLMFKGAMGRLFGQFGTWPIGFTEYMWQNLATPDWGYRTKFAWDYAKIVGATALFGVATGIDTSSWMAGNPLTFQGGPWFQAVRDVATLGTSTNEFELREARAGVSRMVSHMGTPFAGVLNPFGGATADMIQAVNAQNPVQAAILALGFNLKSPTPATQR